MSWKLHRHGRQACCAQYAPQAYQPPGGTPGGSPEDRQRVAGGRTSRRGRRRQNVAMYAWFYARKTVQEVRLDVQICFLMSCMRKYTPNNQLTKCVQTPFNIFVPTSNTSRYLNFCRSGEKDTRNIFFACVEKSCAAASACYAARTTLSGACFAKRQFRPCVAPAQQRNSYEIKYPGTAAVLAP